MSGFSIRVRGIVQGVGFRPMIWRLADQYRLKGSVWNDAEGVMIHAFGTDADLNLFIQDIPLHLPPLAKLDSLEVSVLTEIPKIDGFQILASDQNQAIKTPISTDAATCSDCMAEVLNPQNHRYRYPFTNCTHCGPRLSIINGMPYDRIHTSMSEFTMCSNCQIEYEDPKDRRFHAQTNCCRDCGPKLWLEDKNERLSIDPIQKACDLILQGKIVAIKGLGGFHLACDASDSNAVQTLRERKQRYAKPFALMAKDIDMISRYAKLNENEIKELQGKAAPIVLLESLGERLAEGIAPEDDKLGFMLPYTPLHILLLQNLDRPIVLTSGNSSDEPQCIDNRDAKQKLCNISDYFLLNDRTIVNRLDDSVMRHMDGSMRLLRRARGFTPEALALPSGFEKANGILAMGGELKNSFCMIKNAQAIVSQHVGDLENAAVQVDYRTAIKLYSQLYNFKAECIAVDHHPSYLSTQYGKELAELESAELISVQHHHAHLAACLAEHGISLHAPKVLAALFDGLGMGEKGELWGGEFFLGDYKSYTRLASFQSIALPGGHQAMREPWRNAYAQLSYYFDWQTLQKEYANLDFMLDLANKPLTMLDQMIVKNINSPKSSSCGRWFDAFAAVLGLNAESVAYEGQAAIALETLAKTNFLNEKAYPDAVSVIQNDELLLLNWQGLWRSVLNDLKLKTDKAYIASRIHHSLIAVTVELLSLLSQQTGAETIVLSGGVFQNKLLLEGVSEHLRCLGKTVLTPALYPMNDGGLALGQAVIALARQK